jgi:ABC-type sugar transport system ATPase subunit
MRAEIRRIQKATNITTIFVTHDQEEAMAVGDRLAVLRDGVVEQIGSSDELYNFPKNVFVSNFIGKMNFFNAAVIGVSAEGCRVRLGDGSELAIPAANLRLGREAAVGDEVLVAARPEHLSVAHANGSAALSGEVTIIQHLGHIVRYEVKVPDELSVQTLEIDMDGMVPGISERGRVQVRIDASRAALYTREGER